MKLGYIRVSTIEQNENRQLENIVLDKKFIDKCSGKTKNRPALKELLEFVREDDVIFVHSIDRLGRNLADLRNIIESLVIKKVKIKFIKENLEFTGDDNPISKLMLNMMGSFAEFERDLIKERQLEGIAIAKRNGKYKGRKTSLDKDKIQSLLKRLNNKFYTNKTQLAKEFNIDRSTLYLYIKKYSFLYPVDNKD